MSTTARRAVRVALAALLVVAARPRPALTQETPLSEIAVDYVGVEGVYLAAGTDEGLEKGDTVVVFAGPSDSDPLGLLLVTAVSKRRSIATILDPAFALEAGGTLYAALPAVASGVQRATAPPGVPEEPSSPGREGVPAGPRAARVSGRWALDLEARETRVSWQGASVGDTRRRYATPVTRLSLDVSDLPGGLRLRTSLRASYRYSDGALGPPPASVRAYELAAIKTFESAPLELRLGRFANPYESYSAYWDGLLVRVGGRTGPGVGVAVGFQPSRYDERFSTALPKLTGFADLSTGGRRWRYATDLSVHALRPSGLPGRTYVGWTQRLSSGPLSLSQRLRTDRLPDGSSWSVSQLRIRAGLALGGPVRLDAGYARVRPSLLRDETPAVGLLREETSAGLSLLGNTGSVSLDVGTTRWGSEDPALSLSGSASARMSGLTLLVSGRRWSGTDSRSLVVSPGLSLRTGPVDTRLGYQRYHTEGMSAEYLSQSADLQVGLALAGLRLTVRGQRQWGESLSGTRIQLGIWRSF